MNKPHKKFKYFLFSAVGLITLVMLLNINNRQRYENNLKDNQKIANKETEVNTNLVSEDPIVINKSGETNNTLDSDNTYDEENKEINETVKKEINKLVLDYYDIINKTNKKNQVVKSSDQNREGIEDYEKVKVYIKSGIEADDYVIFCTYNIKFYNISTLAPGMSVLYVTKDTYGKYVINDKLINENLKKYINQISQAEDIKDLIKDVNLKLLKATEKDDALKSFVETLKSVSK